jgi:hypothetical protein
MKRTLQEINDLPDSYRGRTRNSTKKIADELNVSIVNIKREDEICVIEVKVDKDPVELKIDDISFEVKCEASGCKSE